MTYEYNSNNCFHIHLNNICNKTYLFLYTDIRRTDIKVVTMETDFNIFRLQLTTFRFMTVLL